MVDIIKLFFDKGASLNEYARKIKQFRKHNLKKVFTDNPYNSESKKYIQYYTF